MQVNRRALRWVNISGVIIAAGFVTGIAFITVSHNRAAQPKALPGRIVDRWNVRHLAVAAERRKDYSEAERRYSEALTLNPRAQDIRIRRAYCRLYLGKNLPAFEDFSSLVEPCLRSGDQPFGGFDTLVWYADFATMIGRKTDAERAVKLMWQSLRHRPVGKPLLVEAHLWAAPLDSNGLLHAQRAVQIDPSSVEARLTMIALLDTAATKKEANRMFADAKRRIHTPGDWIALAQFYHYSGRYEDAFSVLDHAERLIPDRDASSWSRIARTLEFMEEERRVRLGSPSHAPISVASGYQKRLKSALVKATNTVRPDDGKTLFELSGVYGRLRDFDRRLSLAAASRRATSPRNVEAYMQLAFIFVDMAKKAEGRTMLYQTRTFADEEQRRRIDYWLYINFHEGKPSNYYGFGGIAATPGSLRTPIGQRAY